MENPDDNRYTIDPSVLLFMFIPIEFSDAKASRRSKSGGFSTVLLSSQWISLLSTRDRRRQLATRGTKSSRIL
jgi:hypothetical protein